jgi:putative peptidoglycan lipid II flippase
MKYLSTRPYASKLLAGLPCVYFWETENPGVVATAKILIDRIGRNQLVRNSVLALLSNGIGRLGTLAVPIVIASQYGANTNTDAFYLALSIATFFLNFFQGSLELAFLPLYAECERNDRDEAKKLVGSLVFGLMLLSSVVSLVVGVMIWGFAPLFVENQSVQILTRLTWEVAPVIVLFALVALFTAVFNAERWFLAVGMMPALQSLAVVCFILLLKPIWEIHAVSAAIFTGTLIQAVSMYLFYRKQNSRLELRVHQDHLIRVLRAAAPLALMLALFAIMPLFDKLMVTVFLPSGNVTVIENAMRLSQIPWSLGSVGYMTVFLSWWSSKNAEGDSQFVTSTFRALFSLSCLVFIPASLLLYWGADPLVRLAFGHGKYPIETVTASASVFAYFGLGYWAFMLRSTLIRFYSARRSSSVIARVAVWDVCTHVVVAWVLVGKMGVASIGIATCTGYVVSLAYLLNYHCNLNRFLAKANC